MWPVYKIEHPIGPSLLTIMTYYEKKPHPISWSKTIGLLQKDSKGSKQSKPCATAWSSFKKSGPAPHVYLEMEWILDRELDGTEFE